MTTYTAWGLDFAYGDGITVAELQANQCDFVCRYLSGNPNTGKDLSSTEIKNYKAGNINLVLNWETTGQELTEAQGVRDASSAIAEAEQLAIQSGVPAVGSAPIYFSCDTAPTPSVNQNATAYMRGVNSVIGLARSGGYGGYGTIQALFNAGVITYGWQTYAWSDNQWDPRAQLQQYQNSVTVGPATVDRDRATAADYGQVQWDTAQLTVAVTPAPAPAPVSAARRNTYTPIAADGDFGPASIKAEQFVSFNGTTAECDGVFGPASKKSMQAHLGVAQDGVIGPVTVKALQKRVGAVQDGDWGTQTTKSLQDALNKGTY